MCKIYRSLCRKWSLPKIRFLLFQINNLISQFSEQKISVLIFLFIELSLFSKIWNKLSDLSAVQEKKKKISISPLKIFFLMGTLVKTVWKSFYFKEARTHNCKEIFQVNYWLLWQTLANSCKAYRRTLYWWCAWSDVISSYWHIYTQNNKHTILIHLKWIKTFLRSGQFSAECYRKVGCLILLA